MSPIERNFQRSFRDLSRTMAGSLRFIGRNPLSCCMLLLVLTVAIGAIVAIPLLAIVLVPALAAGGSLVWVASTTIPAREAKHRELSWRPPRLSAMTPQTEQELSEMADDFPHVVRARAALRDYMQDGDVERLDAQLTKALEPPSLTGAWTQVRQDRSPRFGGAAQCMHYGHIYTVGERQCVKCGFDGGG